MAAHELTDDELTAFGILPHDEGPHPFDPREEWWNESWFWDWYDAAGECAGHCRIGMHPAQKRGWVWFFLYNRGEWIVVEEPRLPLADFQLPRVAYEGWGLKFSYDASAALRAGRLQFFGFGRVVAGPRVGMIVPIGADLEFNAVGPPHTTGRGTVPGHSSETFDACRFEQPVTSRGTLRIGESQHPFQGRGERDHSWGPRHWNIEWTFLILNGEVLRLQCVEVHIPNVHRFGVGYLHRQATQSLRKVEFDLQFDDEAVLSPVSGTLRVTAEDDSIFAGRIEVISAAEIDITHTFVPPRRSVYRRALIRVHPDGGGAPILGWMEFNYFKPDGHGS